MEYFFENGVDKFQIRLYYKVINSKYGIEVKQIMQYPNLNAELARCGIKKGTVSNALQICQKSFNNKLMGKSPFTWLEVQKIKERFFPDLDLEYLFATTEEQKD